MTCMSEYDKNGEAKQFAVCGVYSSHLVTIMLVSLGTFEFLWWRLCVMVSLSPGPAGGTKMEHSK